MKKLLTILIVFIVLQASAQKAIEPTESFMVEGDVKQPQSFSLQSLSGMAVTQTDSIVITNHLHERKGVIKKYKGRIIKRCAEQINHRPG